MRSQTNARRFYGQGAVGLLLLLCTPLGLAAEDREQWQQRDRVMTDFGLRPGWRVADVGCGTGYFTFWLARAAGSEGRVIAADVDANALGVVRNRIQKERWTNIDVVQSGATDTKIAPNTLDAAVLCLVLHETPEVNRQPLIRDLARALKPGGFLFIIDWRKSHDVKDDPYEKLIPREELVKLGTDAGLSLDAEFHYLKYQVFLRFRKAPQPANIPPDSRTR